MTDDHDRDTPIPEGRPTTNPVEAPPWEPDFRKTQPVEPPTVEDVLTVFANFRDEVMSSLGAREERILMAINDIQSMILEHYERETKRSDALARTSAAHEEKIQAHTEWISALRERTHTLSHAQGVTEFRLEAIEAAIEERLGLKMPRPPIKLEISEKP